MRAQLLSVLESRLAGLWSVDGVMTFRYANLLILPLSSSSKQSSFRLVLFRGGKGEVCSHSGGEFAVTLERSGAEVQAEFEKDCTGRTDQQSLYIVLQRTVRAASYV